MASMKEQVLGWALAASRFPQHHKSSIGLDVEVETSLNGVQAWRQLVASVRAAGSAQLSASFRNGTATSRRHESLRSAL